MIEAIIATLPVFATIVVQTLVVSVFGAIIALHYIFHRHGMPGLFLVHYYYLYCRSQRVGQAFPATREFDPVGRQKLLDILIVITILRTVS